jgi:hypothetical protein
LKRENIMTNFIHVDYATEHPGVARAESVFGAMAHLKQSFSRSFSATRSLASMLLAALVAALVVVADMLIDTWAEGHLLAAWVALWAVAFAAMALFAPAAKRAAGATSVAFKEWSERAAQTRAEEQYWESAMNDPRVMMEIQAAKLRAEQEVIDQSAMSDAAVAEAKVNAASIPSQHYLRYV